MSSRQPSEGNLHASKLSDLLSPRLNKDLLPQSKYPVSNSMALDNITSHREDDVVFVSVKKPKT